MKSLRQIIRNIISEIYELRPEDLEALESLDYYDRRDPDIKRVLGLQSREEIIEDRSMLQDYQKRLQTHPDGKKMIRAFQNGKEVSVCHSPLYQGIAADLGKKNVPSQSSQGILQNWLAKYGSTGKDVISCVAFNKPIGQSPIKTGHNQSNSDVWTDGIGFYMKGYPVYVHENDVMSQTLGALPKGLTQHQMQSGVAKRASNHGPISIEQQIVGMDWNWAGEVLLDNWRPIGIYINLTGESVEYGIPVEVLLEDAFGTGLDVYLFEGKENLGIVRDMEDVAIAMGFG